MMKTIYSHLLTATPFQPEQIQPDQNGRGLNLVAAKSYRSAASFAGGAVS